MTDNTQTEALLQSHETLMAQVQVFASAWAIAGSSFDPGDGMEVAEQEKAILADMTRRQYARIADLEAQLASIGAGGVSGRLVQAISAEPAGAGYAELPDAKTLGEAVAAWIGVETRGAHNWVDTTVGRLGFAVRSVVGDMLRASHGQAPAQPVAREPLTPERLREIERMCVYANTATLIDFARAIEAAHGIGETP